MPYQHFTSEKAKHYVLEQGFFKCKPNEAISVAEIGDGNLNFVFRIQAAESNTSIIVKQAVPYARCVGESWPLTLDRARIEAQVSLVHAQFCPEHVVNIHHYDETLALMVMEDLSDHAILRSAMLEQQQFPLLPAQIGHYLAQILFYTSDFYLDPHTKAEQMKQFGMSELCENITEPLFFSDPYHNHERNRINPLILEEVYALWENQAIKLAVEKLKDTFKTAKQALLHGDMHTGSIFVRHDNIKVIDAEFGFYGPIGFDVGSIIANFILNYYAQPGLTSNAQEYQAYLLNCIQSILHTFLSEFTKLMHTKTTQPSLKQSDDQKHFLDTVLQDIWGYAGTEIIRRTIGLAHVKELDSIKDPTKQAHCEKIALQFGQFLLLHSQHLTTADVLASLNYPSSRVSIQY